MRKKLFIACLIVVLGLTIGPSILKAETDNFINNLEPLYDGNGIIIKDIYIKDDPSSVSRNISKLSIGDIVSYSKLENNPNYYYIVSQKDNGIKATFSEGYTLKDSIKKYDNLNYEKPNFILKDLLLYNTKAYINKETHLVDNPFATKNKLVKLQPGFRILVNSIYKYKDYYKIKATFIKAKNNYVIYRGFVPKETVNFD